MDESSGRSGKRLSTRDDWVKAAAEILIAGGVEAVKVDVVAMRLNLSKGSFYHHFDSREELLGALLEYWRQWTNQSVADRVKDIEDPCEFLCKIAELVFKENLGRWSPALYSWALQDGRVAMAVRKVHRYRLESVKEMLCRAGQDEETAAVRAKVFHFVVHGICAMPWQEDFDADETTKWVQDLARGLVNCPSAPGEVCAFDGRHDS